MIERLNSLLNIFDVGDLKFFSISCKKKFKKFTNFINHIIFTGASDLTKSRKKIS